MSFRRVFALSVLIASGAALAQQSPTPPESSPPGSSPPASTPSEKQPVEASHGGLVLGDAKAGEGKAAACGACHGMDGNSSDKQYPKLAGQNEAYIARQIKLFQSQKRQNAIMMGFAATLSEQDMHDVGAYFASKSSLAGVADEKLLERGQALYRGGDGALGVPACMACHGPDGRGMAGAGYPQLAGQWADYVQAKLKDWKSGTTWGDDANAKIMPEIARRLGDTDIAALASYVEGLHTATGTATATASTAAP
jgi:cbb3-type cytochrome c oxidase subunit III